ncbi:MAG: 4-hydroxythreonine-4-phosphate dehydrogenase PdxA, partial [Alphaproteobacteria bacterium]
MTARLAITPGEPAGIGPELVVKLAQYPRDGAWIVIGDPDLLSRHAARLGLPLEIHLDAQE